MSAEARTSSHESKIASASAPEAVSPMLRRLLRSAPLSISPFPLLSHSLTTFLIASALSHFEPSCTSSGSGADVDRISSASLRRRVESSCSSCAGVGSGPFAVGRLSGGGGGGGVYARFDTAGLKLHFVVVRACHTPAALPLPVARPFAAASARAARFFSSRASCNAPWSS